MQLALIAHRATNTNLRLLEAVPAGIEATLLSPAETLGRLGDGDAALARLDVLPTVDGIEPGPGSSRDWRPKGYGCSTDCGRCRPPTTS